MKQPATARNRQVDLDVAAETVKTRITAVRRPVRLGLAETQGSVSLLDKEEDCCSRATD